MTGLLHGWYEAGVPLLTLLWLVPALAGGIVARRPERGADAALLVSAAVLLATGAVAWAFHHLHGAGPVFEERLSWGPLGYHVGLDGVGALFLLLAGVLGFLVALYGRIAAKPHQARWQGFGLLLQATLLGMLVSFDLLQFALFGLVELVPAVALLRGWGTGPGRDAAARTLIRFFGKSTALWVAGAAALALTAEGTAGTTFDLTDLMGATFPPRAASAAFFLLLYALAVRLPLFPFHAWLPPVLEHGPVVGMAPFLLGVKVSIVALVRFVLPLLPEASARYGEAVSVMGVVGLVYGALVAFSQTDLRRMLAFAALAHMGFVVPGLFSLNAQGVEGAILESFTLGVAAAGLYFVVGFLHLRTGSSELASLRGLATGYPLLSVTFLVLVLTSVGMPGTSGFEGTHLVLEGALDAQRYGTAVAAGLGAVLAAAVLLLVYQRVMLAPADDAGPAAGPDLQRRELIIATALVGLVLGVGLFVDPWLEAIAGHGHLIEERVGAGDTAAPLGEAP